MGRRHAALVALILLTTALAGQNRSTVERAREMIEAGEPDEALLVLEPWLGRHAKDAEAILLRSTARFMTGETESGEEDLRRALELDDGLRQGWLNLAGLSISRADYPTALDALQRARDLDPSAPDNDLNLGAVQLLLGNLEEGSRHFASYVEQSPTAQAHYLVAANYALSRYEALSLQHLETAIRLDGRMRLQARTDPRFDSMQGQAPFETLLATDFWEAEPGTLIARRRYETPYDPDDSLLVGAALDALRSLNLAFDRRVETTPEWALIWAETRIRISNWIENGEKTGLIEITAPPAAFEPQEWRQRTEDMFLQIAVELERLQEPPRPRSLPQDLLPGEP